MSLEQTPEQASYAEQLAKRERWQARLALSRAWQNLGTPLRDALRAGDQVERERLFSITPHLRSTYDVWCRCLRNAGESTATVQTQRVEQCKRRAKALAAIAKHDRELPDAQLRLKYPAEAEVLRDVAWRLARLRGAPQGLVDWRDTNDRKKLRLWIKRLTQKLFDARIDGMPAEQLQLLADELQRVIDKNTRLEIEEYDLRVAVWQVENAGLRKRPRAPRLNRKLTRGNRLGRPPNAPGYHETHAPHMPRRPLVLLQIDREEQHEVKEARGRARFAAAQARIEARKDKRAVLYSIHNTHAVTTHEERKRAALESRVHELLDWVWGECRLMHIGMLVDGWLYVDDEHGIPRATTPTRAAALAACAVRLSTGWAFPPETSRGRQ